MTDNTIYTYRTKRGITQQQFAELLKLPRTTVSFFETKRQYPDFKTAEKMADILGTLIGKLYSQEELEVIKTK